MNTTTFKNLKSNFILIIALGISLKGCILIPNYNTEWTYPEIKGYVINSLTKTPILNVSVFEKYYGDTIQTDSTGYFNFKARKEYIRLRMITMDGPKPYIDLRFEKLGYPPKEIRIRYIKLDYKREKPDTFDLNQVRLYK